MYFFLPNKRNNWRFLPLSGQLLETGSGCDVCLKKPSVIVQQFGIDVEIRIFYLIELTKILVWNQNLNNPHPPRTVVVNQHFTEARKYRASSVACINPPNTDKMVRGPRARAVPKIKVAVEDADNLKATMNGSVKKAASPPQQQSNPRKRGRAPTAVVEAARAEKRAKLEARLISRRDHLQGAIGSVLTLGQGDTGQLGLGPDIMERKNPAVVKGIKNVISICAGGMHTICLTKEGKVYTFGELNDSCCHGGSYY